MSMFSYFKFEPQTNNKIKIAARLSFMMGYGLFGWLASLANYSVSELNLNAFDFGIILSVKELTIIFGFLLAILLSYISESRLLGILTAVSGTGIILTGMAGYEIQFIEPFYNIFGDNVNKVAVNMTLFTFIISLGMNFFESARDSLVKHTTESKKTTLMLSKISAYGLLGTATGYLFITVIGFFHFDHLYLILYIILGLPLILTGVLSTQQANTSKNLKENIELIIRGKFFNFYVLTFFTAAINILMIFFGVFLLVTKFGMNLGFIGLIFLLHSALTFFFRGKASRFMKRKGEDYTMKIRYAVTIVFFLSLIYIPNKFVLLGILALYGMTKLFDTSIKSFISYFATPAEQRSNTMIYTRLNAFATIIVPLTAGWIWIKFGYQFVFAAGGVLAAICFLTAYKIYSAYQSYDDEPAQSEADDDEE